MHIFSQQIGHFIIVQRCKLYLFPYGPCLTWRLFMYSFGRTRFRNYWFLVLVVVTVKPSAELNPDKDFRVLKKVCNLSSGHSLLPWVPSVRVKAECDNYRSIHNPKEGARFTFDVQNRIAFCMNMKVRLSTLTAFAVIRVGTILEFSRIVDSWFILEFKKRIAIHWIDSFFSIIL